MLYLSRSEFENAASALGFKSATLRQWKCRKKVPGDARNRLTILFDQPFEIIDEPKPQPKSSMTLAQRAASYIKY
jgi:hypothetical protein